MDGAACYRKSQSPLGDRRTTSTKIAHQNIVPRSNAAPRDGTSRAVAGFGPYLIRDAGRGLVECCQSFAFCGQRARCGTELLRHARLHGQQTKTPETLPPGFLCAVAALVRELLQYMDKTRIEAMP